MKLHLGYDYFAARRGDNTPLHLDTLKLINGHMLIVGSSGVGKSHTIKRLLREASKSKTRVRFHVFDVHGDLEIPGASVVQFSEAAQYGLNPLRVNPDPHFGGVRKCIQSFIRTINQASVTALGVKQESVIRNLLTDVFRDFGFHSEEPSTWALNEFDVQLVSSGSDNRLYLEVPFADKEKAQALGARWDRDKKHWWVHTHHYAGDIRQWPLAHKSRDYPTLKDVAEYCRRLHEERFLGSDQRAVRALGALHRKAQTMLRKMLEGLKTSRQYNAKASEEDEAELELARKNALSAYSDYLNTVQTGYELESLMKYDSAEVLKSVMNRLENLLATGIFKAQAPAFDPNAAVWRYKLDALSSEEKKMFVLFTLQDLFYGAVQRGQQDDVVEVIVLDELGTYTSSSDDDSGDGIIGVIAREARKFGLALWGAHQQPTGIPESLIASVGTKVILGIDEMYWPSAVTRLRIETKLLDWVRPHHSMAVQMKEKGALKNSWKWVQLPEN